MPELPEVQTTVNGLKETVIGLRIIDAWSDYDSEYWIGSQNIKDSAYFRHFKKQVIGKEVVAVSRRAKNILIKLNSGELILVHMKMTGHLLFGDFEFDPITLRKNTVENPKPWIPISPESLKDPFNRHIHFVLTFSNGKRLALSDSRKFAKVTLIDAKTMHESKHLKDIGPEPLLKNFTLEKFKTRLFLRPKGKIKQVITDQKIVAGIGNIYADESLWRAGIHPLEQVHNITSVKLKGLFKAIKQTLSKGIDFGGDSMSDYRNIHGEKGRFQEQHYAYQKTGTKCAKPGCGGTITRIVVGNRGTHFCNKHQMLIRKKTGLSTTLKR
ncbi:MAG: bifunctional DNA-formamidopyrimidine glycosylase/DNA-(apurinic or apyrimidinic site) lyase, partial [Patescibacteria group bacterium]